MANTIPNTYLPAGTWVDLYAVTGYPVGKQLRVQNLITNDVRVTTKATKPSATDGYNVIYPFETFTNNASDSGAWAMCVSGGVVNCASVDGSAPIITVPVNSRLVLEGDSITAGTVGPQYSWFVQAMTKAYYFMPNGWNQGTGGESTVQMKAQTLAINALSPNVVCFLGGTNDLQYFTTTAAEIFANIQSCINDYLTGTAKFVIISTILPRNNTWALPAPREAVRLELNTLIRSLASDKIKVVDIASSFDPTLDTTDGLHPNWLGAKKLGDAFTSVLLSIQTSSDQGSLYALPENLFGATALSGTSGTKTGNLNTGVVATGWIAEAADGINVVCSKVVENGVEKQKFVFSGAALANNDGLRFRRAYTANVGINQLVDYMLEVSMTGFSGVRLITASANTAQTPSADQFGQMNVTLNAELMRPPQKALSSPITEIYQYFTVVFNAGPIAGSLTIGKPYLKVIPLT